MEPKYCAEVLTQDMCILFSCNKEIYTLSMIHSCVWPYKWENAIWRDKLAFVLILLSTCTVLLYARCCILILWFTSLRAGLYWFLPPDSREFEDLVKIVSSCYLDSSSRGTFSYCKARLIHNELLEKEVCHSLQSYTFLTRAMYVSVCEV